MRLVLVALSLILAMVPSGAAAAPAATDRLAAISWLAGDWVGVGEGRPGTSAAARRGERIQGNRFLRVEARSVYPPQEGNRAGEVHTSIDLWSFDRRRNLLVLRQFNSLGFVLTYVQDRSASSETRLILVSEHLENVPERWRARYTYERVSPNEYHELFELDSGTGFERYVFNRFLRLGDGPAP